MGVDRGHSKRNTAAEDAASRRWDKFADRTSLRAPRRIRRIPKNHADGKILPQRVFLLLLLLLTSPSPLRLFVTSGVSERARSHAQLHPSPTDLSKVKTTALRPWTVLSSLSLSLFLSLLFRFSFLLCNGNLWTPRGEWVWNNSRGNWKGFRVIKFEWIGRDLFMTMIRAKHGKLG